MPFRLREKIKLASYFYRYVIYVSPDSTQVIWIIACSAVCCLSACATNSRTLYAPMGEQGGYADAALGDRLYVARFSGNPFTRTDDAALFSRFRAVEFCSERGFSLAEILATQSLGPAHKDPRFPEEEPLAGAWSWDPKLKLPIFDTYFRCSNQVYQAGIRLEPLESSNLKGALQVVEIPETSPNRGKFRRGDVILEVNGEPVSGFARFISALEDAPDRNKIPFLILRNGKKIIRDAVAIDATEEFEKRSVRIVDSACAFQEMKPRPLCIFRVSAPR